MIVEGFDSGLIVFFRTFVPGTTNLTRSVHKDGRSVTYLDREGQYLVRNEEGRVLGIYVSEFVSAILPLETVGPGADNQA